MSSLPKIVPSTSNANASRRPKSHSHTPPPSIHELESIFDSWIAWPATRHTSLQPTEDSETTTLGAYYDGGTLDNTSSVTLQDEFPWHEVGVNKYTQRIPSTIVPALLQGVSDVSPPRSSLDSAQDASRQLDENAGRDDLPRYSATQKGKWRARADDDLVDGNDWVGTESLQFEFLGMENPAEDWVAHSRPILQEYADRQTSLPLGRRLEVSINEPSKFILGALHLLVNRDQPGCTDRSRKLGPQLIENFLDIERWAREYFRSRHAIQVVDSDVSTLLTIVMNNFYEGQVQLIDRLVDFALENMHNSGRRTLGVEDFAFGFDFRMSQDLPFYVETYSRVREPFPIRPVEVCSTVEPVITSSGRQVKPTRRAQESVEQAQTKQSEKQNKGKPPQVKDKQATSGSAPALSQPKTSSPQLSSDDKVPEAVPVPSKTTPAHTKHRSVQPSNLRLPPIMPVSSTHGTTPRSDDSVKPKPNGPVGVEKSDVMSDSNLAQRSSSRLKVKLPPMSSKGPVASDPVSTSNDSDRTTASTSAPIQERVTRRSERTRPGGPRNLGGGCGRGRGRGAEVVTPAKTPDATSVSAANAQPTTPPLGTGNAVPSAVDTFEGHPVVNPAKSKSLAGTSSAGSHETVDNTERPLLWETDPGHPRRKKRKLDDCDD